jgi:hypothetical protein
MRKPIRREVSMRRSSLFRAITIFAAAITAGASCHDTTSPSLSPQIAAGTYLLESVHGRGPSSGTFLLTSAGLAERRVRYPLTGSAASAEYVAIGSFELKDGRIDFALREDAGNSDYVWHVGGNRSPTHFSIEYPDPADGPNIVETYVRP